jgi:conjugal transfer pilus assembly protein TraV
MKRFTAMLVASLAVSGCSTLNIGSDKYSCPGMPGGVQCLSARDVYAATNDGQIPRPMKDKAEKAESTDPARDTVIDSYVAPRLPDRPIPIRTPAQVMRIWVAPWEDINGDLIVSGYIYTEIEPRRWVIGDGVPQSEPILKPLQIIKHEPKSETRKENFP